MSKTYGATELGQTASSTRCVSRLLKRYWYAFQERPIHQILRATLPDLTDRELMDIDTTRGEIEYVASNPRYRPARHPIHPSDKCVISGTDGWPELDTTRRTIPRGRFPVWVQAV